MTFNKMRFPIVWITLVVLCSFEVQCGPTGQRQDVDIAYEQDSLRSPRQEPYEEDSDEDDEDDDDEEQQLNYPGPSLNEEDADDDEGGDYERRSFRRRREASQKPLVALETEEESVIPVQVPEKKPSVLELLSSALDKAIEATSKIPTQQVASDAAGVFQILGQVFSEAIDKVIGGDEEPGEETAEVAPEGGDNKIPEEELPATPTNEQLPMKVEEPQETSQSDKEIVNNL